MIPPTTTVPAARDVREGLSPSPQLFGLADIWDDDDDDDDDDIEYQPASEQSEDISQDDTEEDGESDYMGTAALSHRFRGHEADLE
jgi:hypothetical protein